MPDASDYINAATAGIPAPNAYAQIVATAMKLKQMRDDQQTQNALRALYADPNNIDPQTGQLKQNALLQIAKMNPAAYQDQVKAGLDAQHVQAEIGQERSTTQKNLTEAQEKQAGMQAKVFSDAQTAYQASLDDGNSPEVARAAGQKAYNDGLDGLKQGGLFSPDQLERMPSEFDPTVAKAHAQTWEQYQQNKERQAAETERERHDRATEGQGAQRIKLAQETQNATPILDDEGVQYAADQYRINGTLPPMGFGKPAAKLRQQIIERAAQDAKSGRDPYASGSGAGADTARTADVKASRAALVQGEKQEQAVKSFEGTAVKEADLVLNLLDKGGSKTASPIANRWVQAGRRSIAGDPDVSAFDSAIKSFANEYARIMTAPGATGGGATTDTARREADALINGNMSPAQVRSTIATMKKSMANRLEALDAENKDIRSHLSGGRDTGSGGAANPPGGGISAVSSKSEYDALPKGAHYSKPGDPPGTFRVKGG